MSWPGYEDLSLYMPPIHALISASTCFCFVTSIYLKITISSARIPGIEVSILINWLIYHSQPGLGTSKGTAVLYTNIVQVKASSDLAKYSL